MVLEGSDLTSEEKARLAATAAQDLKANEVVVLDVQGQTQLADFFVVCSGTSDVHIRAIADAIIEKLRENGIEKPRREGVQAARWVLLDYEDVVVHIFSAEEREYYNLESFWSGARVLELTEEARGQHEPAIA
jgi:ribosome-associated protein